MIIDAELPIELHRFLKSLCTSVIEHCAEPTWPTMQGRILLKLLRRSSLL